MLSQASARLLHPRMNTLMLLASAALAAAAVTIGLRSPLTEAASDTQIRSATVGASGTVFQGQGVLSATKFGTGAYEVTFDRNMQPCVPVVSRRGGLPGIVYIETSPSASNRVKVRAQDLNGNFSDRSFHLVVACPQ